MGAVVQERIEGVLIPSGLCQCGCGQRTRIPTKSNTRDGYTKGVPLLYRHGHGHRVARGPIEISGDVAYVPLTRGQKAIIDACDLPSVAGYEWLARWNPQSRTFYAMRGYRLNGDEAKHNVQMHRQLMCVSDSTVLIDHANGNGLDNRRSNLRVATNSQNGINRHRLNSRNSSGHTGVLWHRGLGRWTATIGVNNKLSHIGCFSTKKAAIAARALAEREYFGEFSPEKWLREGVKS